MARQERTTQQRSRVGVKKSTAVGELRQDLITGKWVVMAPERSKRPHDFGAQRSQPKALPKFLDDCPFCRLDLFPQKPDVLRLPDDPDSWQVHVFGNKYPAFTVRDEFRSWNTGPYRALEAVGYHEILATRWHNQTDAQLTHGELLLQLEALLMRYRQLRTKPSVNYIQIIKNYGAEAGASLEHPHHQIFTSPVLPHDVIDVLRGVEHYWQTYRVEPFELLLHYEREVRERIIFENDAFVAFCPFASRVPFEVLILPRQPLSFFEDSTTEQLQALAEALLDVLRRLYAGLHDPPYNYYILSAPCDETGFVCDRESFTHFRWHVSLMPRLNVWGGFELGTGLEINPVFPEVAASFLRSQKTATV